MRFKKILFGELLNIWLQNNNIRQKSSTISKYKFIIEKHIIPQLGDYTIKQITPTLINNFLSEKLAGGRLDQRGGLSPAYVRTIAIIIDSAMKLAACEGWCKELKSPIIKPIQEKKDFSVFSTHEHRLLEDYIFSEPTSANIGIVLSLQTGMRIGEICALTWDDVDLENALIHVRHTVSRVPNGDDLPEKTKLIIDTPKTPSSVREIPISPAMVFALLKIKSNAKSPFIISTGAKFVSPRTFEYRYHKTLSKIGIPQKNFHSLRHTFATRCIEAGVDVKSLCELLGHSGVTITLDTYVHSSLNTKRKQLEKLFDYQKNM